MDWKKTPPEIMLKHLLLSLSGVLEESLQDPLIRSTIAGETLDTLEKLQKLLDRPTHNG